MKHVAGKTLQPNFKQWQQTKKPTWQLTQWLKWTGFRFISFHINTHFQYEDTGLWPLAKTDRAGVKSVHLPRKRFLISAVCHLLALTALKLSCQRPPEQAPRDDCQVHGDHSPPPTPQHTLQHLSVEQRTAHWWLGWRDSHTHTHTHSGNYLLSSEQHVADQVGESHTHAQCTKHSPLGWGILGLLKFNA